MQVVYSDRVKTMLQFLSHDERERVQAWLDYLGNGEDDDFVRSRSVLLNVQGESMYLFRTTTELYIFYTVDQPNKTVSVIDITNRETILASGGVPAGVS